MGIRWGQARTASRRAVDVGHGAAFAADDVVVVVPDAKLVEGDAAGGLYASHQAHLDQGGEHVVDGLGGDGPKLRPDVADDRVGAGMRLAPQRGEDGEARCGRPQPGRPQCRDERLS